MTQAKFSASTGGIYPLAIYKEFPEDALDIPDDLYMAFQSGEVQHLDVADGSVVEFMSLQSLADMQAARIVEMTSSYNAAVDASVSYTTTAKVTQTFQADSNSRDLLQEALAMFQSAGATPSGFYWVAEDNTQVPFAYADLQGLAAAFGAQGWPAFQKLQARKASIRAATTVAAVQAITW